MIHKQFPFNIRVKTSRQVAFAPGFISNALGFVDYRVTSIFPSEHIREQQ